MVCCRSERLGFIRDDFLAVDRRDFCRHNSRLSYHFSKDNDCYSEQLIYSPETGDISVFPINQNSV